MTQRAHEIALILKDLAFPVLIGVVIYFGTQYLNKVDRIETILYDIRIQVATINTRMDAIQKDNERHEKMIEDLQKNGSIKLH